MMDKPTGVSGSKNYLIENASVAIDYAYKQTNGKWLKVNVLSRLLRSVVDRLDNPVKLT